MNRNMKLALLIALIVSGVAGYRYRQQLRQAGAGVATGTLQRMRNATHSDADTGTTTNEDTPEKK